MPFNGYSVERRTNMNSRKYERKSRYCRDRRNKADNYTHLNKHYCQKGQIVLAGDSITDMYYHYELFEKYRSESGKKVYNRGISGDCTNRLLERLENNVLCLEPEKIVYLIGTNDLAFGASKEYVAENIREIIERTKHRCPGCKIAFQSVYPVNRLRDRKNRDMLALNVLIKEICRETDSVYIDLYDALCDSEGNFDMKYTYDGLHPNVHGYEIITKAILEFI